MRSGEWGPHNGISALRRRDTRELFVLSHVNKRSCEHTARRQLPISLEKRPQNEE